MGRGKKIETLSSNLPETAGLNVKLPKRTKRHCFRRRRLKWSGLFERPCHPCCQWDTLSLEKLPWYKRHPTPAFELVWGAKKVSLLHG